MKLVRNNLAIIIEITLVCLISLIVLSYFFNRGFNYYDEGHILHLAERILHGDVPYRDFHFIYTPGTLYVTAVTFLMLGTSILSGRILLLITAVITSALIYFLTRKVTVSRAAGMIGSCVYLAWSPSHINFPWPIHFAILCGCIILLACTRHTDTRKAFSLIVAGVMVFATFFFKQNFGIAAIIIMAAYILPRPNRPAHIIHMSVGLVSASLLYVLYVLISGSYMSFYRDMLFYSYQKILVERMLWTPFIYGSGLPAVVKTLFFLSPLLIVSVGWFLLYRQKAVNTKDLYIFSFPAAFYILGIRPTTDFIHLAPLLSLAGIVLGFLIARTGRKLQIAVGILTVIIVLTGFYTALFRGYYRWETPLVKQHIYVADPRIRIYVDTKYRTLLSGMKQYFSSQQSKDVLIYEYAPTFYTALNLRNPTAYDLIPSSAISADIENEVVSDLKNKDIQLIISDSPLDTRAPTNISQYIHQNYVIAYSEFEFSIWRRKETKAD